GDALAEGVDDLHRCVGTEVRHEERVLDFLPSILVQIACAENAEHTAADNVLGLRHTATQLAEAALDWRDLLGAGSFLLLGRGCGVLNRVYGLVLSRCRSGVPVVLFGLLLLCSVLRGRGWRSREVVRRGGLLCSGWPCRDRLLAASLLLLLNGGGCWLSRRYWRGPLIFLRGECSLVGVDLLSRGQLWLGLRWCRLLSSLRVSLASRLGLLVLLERSRDAHPADIHRRTAGILRGRSWGLPARDRKSTRLNSSHVSS